MLWITTAWGLCFLAIRLGLQDARVACHPARRVGVRGSLPGRTLVWISAGVCLVLAWPGLRTVDPAPGQDAGRGTKDSDAAHRAGR